MTLILMLLCLVFPGGILGFIAIILLGLVSDNTVRTPKDPLFSPHTRAQNLRWQRRQVREYRRETRSQLLGTRFPRVTRWLGSPSPEKRVCVWDRPYPILADFWR